MGPYLRAQIELADLGICCGVVADAGFLLLCGCIRDGSEPEGAGREGC